MCLLPRRMGLMCRIRPLLLRQRRRLTAAVTAGTGNALPTKTLPGKPVTHLWGQIAAFLTELSKSLARLSLKLRHHKALFLTPCWSVVAQLGMDTTGSLSLTAECRSCTGSNERKGVCLCMGTWTHQSILPQSTLTAKLDCIAAGQSAARPARRGRRSSRGRGTARVPRRMRSTRQTAAGSATSAASRG